MPDSIHDAFSRMTSAKAASEGEDTDGKVGASSESSDKSAEKGAKVPDDKLEQAADGKDGGSDEAKGSDDSGAEGEDSKSKAGDKPAKVVAGAKPTELEQIRLELDAANARITALLTHISTAEPSEKEAEKVEPEKVGDITLDDFMTNEEYLDAIDNKEALEAVLKKVAKASYDKGTEATLKIVPSMVKREVSSAIAVNEAVREFWQNNGDMKPYRGVFATIIDGMQKKEPGLTVEQLLQKAEVETRMQMRLPRRPVADVEKKVEDPDKKPAFVKGSQSRVEARQPGKIHEDFLKLAGKTRT